MEAKWGVERLHLLVDAELRAKFERQRLKVRDALSEAWSAEFLTRAQLDAAIARCAALERAWAALDAQATSDRQMPIAAVVTVLEGRTHDGQVLAVVETNAEAKHVLQEGRGMVVLTLEEVANLLKAVGPAVEIKRVFPGATITAPRDRSWVKTAPDPDDEIPF
jgi:hypothetical protein